MHAKQTVRRLYDIDDPDVATAYLDELAILAPCQQVRPGGPVRNDGGAGLTTVRQVPATAARESNP